MNGMNGMNGYGPLATTALGFDTTVRQLVQKSGKSGITTADLGSLTRPACGASSSCPGSFTTA